ncbi:response regulator [Paenibacillus sinopodophylli]|uniref:response regulator n=1 Tax=Paenibacillus sinopodophylli TaxID=1837342 RepID=UPI00110C96AF|nr:response regulator [Paenibacillus sinopodophylli]
MYKLLIVEDERWEREGLIDFLDWTSLGIELLSTARDGIEGLEQTLELEPDIVITDIRMPGMDGLEMSRRIKKAKPHIRIIILTGYGDFEYARKAIDIRASHYVLKPINEHKLLEAIQKVIRECEEDVQNKQEREKLRSEALEHREQMKEKWLNDLLFGSLDPKLVRELAQVEGFGLGLGQYVAYAIAEPKQARGAERLRSLFPNPCMLAYSDHREGQWIIVIPEPKEPQEAFVAKLVRQLTQGSGWLWPSKMIIGAGTAVDGLTHIAASVKQAEQILAYASFWDVDGIVGIEQVERERTGFLNEVADFLQKSSQQVKAIVHAVHALDEPKALAGAEEMFQALLSRRGAEGDYIRHYISGLLFELSVLSGMSQSEGRLHADPGEQLYALPTLAAINVYTLAFITETIKAIREKRDGKEEYVIRQVNKLIEQRFISSDISLKSIAEEVFLSPNYLGSLYKKSTGQSFHDKLAAVRMEKAKSLLALPHYKVAAVAQEVGIPSTSYFCTVFKNTFGISPGEYQEMLHRK